ncbi:MAG: TetR/AcrR family transcriptional regulator [Myxococcota bacterium]
MGSERHKNRQSDRGHETRVVSRGQVDKHGQAGGHERAEGKRERILASAIRVFAEKGFYATRVSEIAKAAGVADGTIYLYFKNKDDVLISIFEDRLSRLLEVLREEVARESNVERQLEKIVDIQLGLIDGRDLAEVLTVNLRQSSKLLKQYAEPRFREYLCIIANVIASGQAEGTFRKDVSPGIAARSLWGALDGLTMTWALSGTEPSNLRKAARQFLSIYLAGLKAPRQT